MVSWSATLPIVDLWQSCACYLRLRVTQCILGTVHCLCRMCWQSLLVVLSLLIGTWFAPPRCRTSQYHRIFLSVSLEHRTFLSVSLEHRTFLSVSLEHRTFLSVSLEHRTFLSVSLEHRTFLSVSVEHRTFLSVSLEHRTFLSVSLE